MILGTYTPGLIDTVWPIIFVFTVSYGFYFFKDQIRASHWRKTIPIILLLMMLTFEGHFMQKFAMIPFVSLSETFNGFPLHLCSTSAVLVMLYLGFKKEIFLDLLILQGIIGSIVTFVFPNMSHAPHEYYYWKFFLSHAVLFLTPTFFMIVEEKKVGKRQLFIGLIAVHVFAFIAVIVNLGFDQHYMYLTPDSAHNLFAFIPLHNALPFLDSLFGCILFGEVLAFVAFFLTYYIIRFFQGDLKKDS